MKKITIALISVCLLQIIVFAQETEMSKIMQSWEGRDIDSVISSWGSP